MNILFRQHPGKATVDSLAITDGQAILKLNDGVRLEVNPACVLKPQDHVNEYANVKETIMKIVSCTAGKCLACQNAGLICPATALPQAMHGGIFFNDSITIN